MSGFSSGSVHNAGYDYILPAGRIAKFPLKNPASSQLLVYDRGKISHSIFSRFVDYIDKDELLLFNDTRVVQARVIMRKPTGSRIEIFLLEPLDPSEYNLVFSAETTCRWKCLVGNKKKWKRGLIEKEFYSGKRKIRLFAGIVNDNGSWQEIEFKWEPGKIPFSRVIEAAGLTPIPPYLDRDPVPSDRQRYQTVYSRFEGSVAAPTAGLHFTKEILGDLQKKGILTGEITLHVGAGTFQPVRSTIDRHEMHTEHFSASIPALEKIYSNTGRITAVGTTTARTLETIYWLGVRLIYNGENISRGLTQWEIEELPGNISSRTAIRALLEFLAKNSMEQFGSKTQLMIIPGYRFRLVNKLVTNFHQPKSTLLLLIAAFIGEDWKKVYDYALKNDFRFLSYGDSSLLIPRR